MKILYILRGLPGSGKSTVASTLTDIVMTADDYFTDRNGTYNFDASKLKEAHNDCYVRTRHAMKYDLPKIAVANTNTQEWEFEKYENAAREFGYTVFHLIVENRHGNSNIHGVPDEALDRMKERFEIKL